MWMLLWKIGRVEVKIRSILEQRDGTEIPVCKNYWTGESDLGSISINLKIVQAEVDESSLSLLTSVIFPSFFKIFC